MSADPERLLSANGADPLEQELLGSVRHVGPPEGAKDDAWRRIAAQISVGVAVGVVSSSSAAAVSKASAGGVASWALSTKIAVVAGGLALGGGYVALRSPAPAAPGPAPRATAAPVTRAVPPARLEKKTISSAPEEQDGSGPAPAKDVVGGTSASARSEPRGLDSLKAESSLLTEARAQLRSGNVAVAQALLDRLQQRFAQGVLTQEREVLGIEVAFARGNVEVAKRRARAFVKAYPKSPHSAKLARFLD